MFNQTDEIRRILDDMKNGSIVAFDQFYDRFAPFVFRIALGIVKEQMEAEDICHDVFLEVFSKVEQFDPMRGSVESWLAVKTRSRCLDRLKRKKFVVTCQLEESKSLEGSSGNSAEAHVLSKLERETIYEAMKRIPVSQQQAVYGMYYESQSQRELSQKLGRPLGTIKSLVRYGLNNLRKQLSQLGWVEASGGGKKDD
ncbi:sigma-70 family RNA polymerase sigma factor [Microaerobacter geothermalis]|uniref:RNA polymerase sigma factor n=1 Tax=Microaerobacter geothermalis TaxID=674972 RepID=UPI001F1DAC5E|nr:sigma-70 family RNA polymerase sigma factor [Microaerobacter geothermalis]MCF6094633.1 sigma-70 family RNA polymerase sigma factor [Microaerobacter geothermalis]